MSEELEVMRNRLIESLRTFSKEPEHLLEALEESWEKRDKQEADFNLIELELVNQARILRADPHYGKTEDEVFIARLRYEVLVRTREERCA